MTVLGSFELNQIYTGDARELSKGVPDESIDLFLTDPPFGINFDYANDYNDDPAEYIHLIGWVIANANRVIKPGGLCFVFVAQKRLRDVILLFPENSRIFAACRNFTQFYPTPVQFSYDPVFFWQKKGKSLISPMAGRRDWHIGNTAYYVTLDTFHSCPRPQNTVDYMVSNFCPSNGIILDCFLGSGTTAISAKKMGKWYIGFEIDPATAELARERVRKTQPPLFVLEPTQEKLWD